MAEYSYAMTGRLTAQPGRRSDLASILLRASNIVGGMSGCKTYIVMEDARDESVVWVFEMWADKESHDASLQDGRVRALISEALPIIAGAPDGSELRVLGGYGAQV